MQICAIWYDRFVRGAKRLGSHSGSVKDLRTTLPLPAPWNRPPRSAPARDEAREEQSRKKTPWGRDTHQSVSQVFTPNLNHGQDTRALTHSLTHSRTYRHSRSHPALTPGQSTSSRPPPPSLTLLRPAAAVESRHSPRMLVVRGIHKESNVGRAVSPTRSDTTLYTYNRHDNQNTRLKIVLN